MKLVNFGLTVLLAVTPVAVHAGESHDDARRLSLWLDELNIEHLVTVSGPSGGRHVWIALEEATDPHLIRELADLAGSLLPSLDKSPLSNPDTGCVRPPGAPHRHGGGSSIARGTIATLQRAGTSVDELALLRLPRRRSPGANSAHSSLPNQWLCTPTARIRWS